MTELAAAFPEAVGGKRRRDSDGCCRQDQVFFEDAQISVRRGRDAEHAVLLRGVRRENASPLAAPLALKS